MKTTIGAALALSATLLVVGCAETPTEVAQTPVSEPAPKVLPGLSPTERLRRGLALLEDGDEATARAEISLYQSRTTNSSLARSLMRQIDLPPEKYFPPQYREVILRKGQSLSNIAQTYLGSAVEFHALAKYNGIAQPRRMFPGQIVKVPLTSEAREAFAELEDALDEPSFAGMPLAENLSSSSDDVAASGDPGTPPESEDVEPTSEPDLVPVATSATASSMDDATGDGSHERAGEVSVANAAEATESSRLSAPGVSSSSRISDEPEGDAVHSVQSGTPTVMTEEVEAQTEAEPEAAADEVEVVALSTPVPDAPPVDVDALHRRAINAYRAQDLDTAIALWNEVLEADPSYEGARLYRSQALALRKRLKSFK